LISLLRQLRFDLQQEIGFYSEAVRSSFSFHLRKQPMNKNRTFSGEKIKIAIVGVGNCASSLVQGIHYYKTKTPEDAIGLMH